MFYYLTTCTLPVYGNQMNRASLKGLFRGNYLVFQAEFFFGNRSMWYVIKTLHADHLDIFKSQSA